MIVINVYYNYLAHYGIKGQKWGVRRFQNKDGTLTAVGKKRYSDNIGENDDKHEQNNKKLSTKQKIVIGCAATAAVIAVAGGLYVHKKNSYLTSINVNSIKRGKYAVDTMSKETILPKGSTIFRTSNNNKLRDDLTYASINRNDKNRYIIRMGSMYSRDKLYQMKIKTSSDIKIPSEKTQFDMFVDLLTNDKDFSRNITHNPYGKTMNVFGNRKLAEEFASDYHYENFITRVIDLGTNYDKDGSLSKYANYVKSKGYKGLIDVNDVGTTSEKPVIIFDSKDTLVIDSVSKINAGAKFVAGLMLKNVSK